MSNGEMFIVAKPHFETTSSGQSELSIVDVWIVPDNGQGRVPSSIDELRAGRAPRQNTTRDPQRFYQPLTSQNSFQHMTLIRTPRGWEIQPDVDPRLAQYRVPRISQDQVDQRFLPGGFRANNSCSERSRATQFVDPRSQQFRVQIDPQYSAVDPRGQFRVQLNPQFRAVDPRFSQIDYQGQYQNELRRIPDQELQQRYDVLMQRRQTEQERMLPHKINPRLSQPEYQKQYQQEIQRRHQVELQRRADAELQRTFEVEMRRRANEQQQRTQTQYQTQTQWNSDPQVEFQRTTDDELWRRYQVEMQRRYSEQQHQDIPQWTPAPPIYNQAPQVARARPQGRATYGVDPSIGLALEQRNQQMRRELGQFEGGYLDPRPAIPQGRARYGVDPRAASEISRRDSQLRDDTTQLDDEIFSRPSTQPRYRPQYQTQPDLGPDDPSAPVDPSRWAPKQSSLRSWKDNLDFDPDGTKVRENVGTYLGRYGPANQPTRNPNGVYGPSPLSPQGMIEGSVDSTLRSWGNYFRGK